jgi:hypothetical protein
MADLDAHEPAASRIIEQARHLETAEGELLGNFDFRAPVKVVPSRHRRGEDELRRASRVRCDHVEALSSVAHLSGNEHIIATEIDAW